MIENRFFEDSTISNLRQIEVLIFLKCLSIAGDLTSSCISIHAGLLPRRWRVNDQLLLNCLKTLEENQLLTIENGSLIQYNTKQKKTKQKEKTPTLAEAGEVLPVVEFLIPSEQKQKITKKPKPELKQVTTPEELEKEIGPDGINKLLSMFEMEHINAEFPYMAEWLSANRRKQKNYTLFVMNWLKRSKAEYEARKRTKIDYNASMRMR